MPEENAIKSLKEMELEMKNIRKHLQKHHEKLAFLAKESDFDDLINFRGELKDSILLSTKLFEQWITRKMPEVN